MTTAQEWKKIIPINHLSFEYTDYPLNKLPDIIRNAIESYAEYGKQPIPLLANSALSCVSLACQGLANVARDELLVSPVSMYFITVASSGERKTASDKVFGKGLLDWEHRTVQHLEPEYEKQKHKYTTWSVKRKALLQQIRRFALQDTETLGLERDYDLLMREQPEVPLLPNLKYEDITTEALMDNLANKWPSSSIWSDEASIFLGSPGMQKDNTKIVGVLNRLWDGQSISSHRKTSADVIVKDRRFTLSLMMQPLLLQTLLNKNDGINRQSGFLARTLMCYPKSTIGERFYQSPPENISQHLLQFNERIQQCLTNTLPIDKEGLSHIPTLTFSNKAKQLWIDYFNYIENAIANEFHWQSIHDLASKAAENIARLSALFHLFQHKQGTEIEKNEVESAFQIIEWHLNESKRIFGETKLNQTELDARLILTYIQ